MPAIAAGKISAKPCRFGRDPIRRRPHRQREQVALLLSELMRASGVESPSRPSAALGHRMEEDGGGGPAVAGLALDSRKVKPGYLFAAVAGAQQNGTAFIADAVSRGAVAILAARN